MAKLFTYDRDIICLPHWHATKDETIEIPRSRDDLSKHGLIGKVRLSSDMTEEEVLDEIRSIFHTQMNDDPFLKFHILQATGGTNKSLTILAVSSSSKWTAAAIVGKNAKAPIYILAKDKLKVCGVLVDVRIHISVIDNRWDLNLCHFGQSNTLTHFLM